MTLYKKIFLKPFFCLAFGLLLIVNAKAQVCGGSWALNNPLTLGCTSGQFVGATNPTADPPGCPTNPIYLGAQTNTFTFTNPVSTFTIDFRGFDSSPGCARIEVKINGIFYSLTSANLIDLAQNPGGSCTTSSPAYRVTVTNDGYITSNSLGTLGGGSVGGIYITNVNATSVSVSTNDANGTLFSNPYNCLDVIPLKLESFSGSNKDCKSLLSWKTGIEQNLKNIEIQKSEDGSTFKKEGEVNPLGSNSNYSFAMFNSTDTYFRLKINDLDGAYEYSQIIYLKSSCNKISYVVIPNPASSQLEIIGLKSNDQVLVLDMLGNVIEHFYSSQSNNKLNIQALPAGIYIFQGINADMNKAKLKVIKK